uniref:Helicase ATP-binding domain-containing protein n=1 Tax=viral metagenome TaxID=1070528 RepID=A0A6C0EIB5_9ZZZZ
MPKKIKNILSNRGFAIIKIEYGFRDINRTKKELTVLPYINDSFGGKAKSFPIYLESDKKLYLPKYYGFENFGDPDQIKNLSDGLDIDIEFKGTLRDKQLPSVDKFLASCEKGNYTSKSNGGIISLPCGYGKTIIALYIISKLKKKSLIIVHKEFLINQWIERIQEFLPDARIGIIQAAKIDIKNKDIVIGMLQSISMKEYESTAFNDFGFTIIDEVHHIAAEVFSRSLPKINSKYSLGLSATPKRKDGLSKVFHWFLGPMIYEIKMRDDYPVDVNIAIYNSNDPIYNRTEVTYNGKMCMPRMINNITEYSRRIELIIIIVKKLMLLNKKILILSDRRNHLTAIYELIKNTITESVGYYVGGMKQKDLKLSESKQILLGTYTMSSEGMDIPDLDAVIFASPKSDIIQSLGRILRKKHINSPIVWDIVDNFSPFINQYNKRRAYYRKMKYPIQLYTVNDSADLPTNNLITELENPPKLDNASKKVSKLLNLTFVND